MNIGQLNTLVVQEIGPYGLILSSETDGRTVTLPTAEAPAGIGKDDSIEVFIYTDSEGQPAASIKKAILSVGETGCLSVVARNDTGVWLDYTPTPTF